MQRLPLCLGIPYPVAESINALLSLLEVSGLHGTWQTPLLCRRLARSGLGPPIAALRSCVLANCLAMDNGCWEIHVGCGGPTHTTEFDLALSFLYVTETLFHPGLITLQVS